MIGETPNLAARLQTLAEPGTVLICRAYAPADRWAFRIPRSRPGRAQGMGGAAYQPGRCWRRREVESRFEAQHKTRLTPLIGRDEEIELLLRRWQHAKRGEGRVVVLTGEPGIGKSHIALALAGAARNEPHITVTPVLFGASHQQCAVSIHRPARTGRPVRAWRFAGGEIRQARSAARAVRRETDARGTSGQPSVAAAQRPLSACPSSARRNARRRRWRRFWRSSTAWRRDSRCWRSVEDVHWIDPTSLELLTHGLGAAAAASGTAADHRAAGIHAAMAGSCTCDDALADAAEPTRRARR